MTMNVFYYPIFAFWFLLSLFPLRLLYLVSDLLFFPLYYLVRYRRKTVRKNLISSFPEKTEAEVQSIEKKFYSFFCDYVVETIKEMSISEKQMRRRMTFSGTDELIADMERKGARFTFIYLGHYCNWEWIASMPYWFPEGVNCGQIYHPLYNKAFNELFLKLRGRHGAQNIAMKETLRRIIEMKRNGKHNVIGFISDQAPKWNSIHHFTPFLNHETPVFTGTEKIGQQVNAIIYFADVSRPKRGYYHCHLYRLAEDVKTMKEFELTDLYMQHLEKMIRREPQYWLWSHNRWKRTREEWERRTKNNEN